MSNTSTSSAPLDLDAFIAAVEKRLPVAGTLEGAVAWVLEHRQIDDYLTQRFLLNGATDIAGDHILRNPRDEIIRKVRQVYVTRPHVEPRDPIQVEVTIIPSPLRYWQLGTVEGKPRRLEEATVEEVEHEIEHLDSTIAGIAKRRNILSAVVKAARNEGIEVIGELDDVTLDNCILEGEYHGEEDR